MTDYECGVNDALMYMHKILEHAIMMNQLLEGTPNFEDLTCSMEHLWHNISANPENKGLCKQACERLTELEDILESPLA